MPIIRWRPFEDLEEFFDETFPSIRTQVFPAANVFEDDGNIVIKSSISGVAPEDLDVEVSDDSVTIKGERKEEEKEKKGNFYRREISYGSFSRTIQLPQQIDKDSAESTFENGILTVILPKMKGEERGIRKIKPKIK